MNLQSSGVRPLENGNKKDKKAHKEKSLIITIGYEGRTIEDYIHALLENKIQAVIDVRHNASSRLPFFSKTKLSEALNTAGIEYFHIRELGVPSSLRKGLKKGPHDELFGRYKEELSQKKEYLDTIGTLAKQYGVVALTCFEREYRFCHRHIISEYLEKEVGFTVKHI